MTGPSPIDGFRHLLKSWDYRRQCREVLHADGALVLAGFFTAEAVARVVADSARREDEAYYALSTHNVYLTPLDPELADDHPFNRQVVSSKGLLADDQIPADSPLRTVYDDLDFRDFLCAVLGIDEVLSLIHI